MAAPVLIPNNRTVFRGMRNPSWSKNGVVRYLAFMLRPASNRFSIEEQLSLGLTAESAVDELKEHFGIAALHVLDIHNLSHNLSIRPDPHDANKAEMFGLPLHSTDPAQIDLAVTMATDLANIVAYFISVRPG
jgi:hypothetical protein